MKVPPRADRDFTASGFVVDDGRVLLVDHASFGRWLQPGGHVEPRETPDEAAVREVKEETGVVMRIHDLSQSADADAAEDLPEPFRVTLHEVSPDHWHVDFAYLGTVGRVEEPADGETMESRWFTRSELASADGVDDHARETAVSALDRIG